ncbi:MAG: hypothetical protein PHD31_00680 [Candidatus Pacebacteria bacterium]|nr:hypothetical protein [Candidatus Paceibacterota bacterium]
MLKEKGISMVIMFLSVLVLGIFSVFIYHQFFSNDSSIEENNFIKTGNLVKDNPGLEPGVWYLVYEMPGSPAINKKLSFDDKSICFDSCSELIQGEKVIIKGIENNGIVLVRELDFFEEDFTNRSGPTVVDWDNAVSFLSDCQVEKASQNHNKDVYLDLKDGSKIYTVEPEIDIILKTINQFKAKCGSVPLATE